jgi:hypothetical protein
MGPLYIATERFGPHDPAWQRYLEWSSLHQLTELVSLDSILCKPIIDELIDEDWAHVVNEDFMTGFFTDLDYLVTRTGPLRELNLLCVYRNPATHPRIPPNGLFNFSFEGYDLVEVGGGVSALTNCGGFPKAFTNGELSEHGLLRSLYRATEIQRALREVYPEEPHALCDIWEIFRAKAT